MAQKEDQDYQAHQEDEGLGSASVVPPLGLPGTGSIHLSASLDPPDLGG